MRRVFVEICNIIIFFVSSLQLGPDENQLPILAGSFTCSLFKQLAEIIHILDPHVCSNILNLHIGRIQITDRLLHPLLVYVCRNGYRHLLLKQ